MIRELYDNSIVAYKTASNQTVNLVLDTIRLAMRREKKKVAAELQLHSDQGFQYTSQAYFKLTQSYKITPYVSRRGNPYENARLKTSSLSLNLNVFIATNLNLYVNQTTCLLVTLISIIMNAFNSKQE